MSHQFHVGQVVRCVSRVKGQPIQIGALYVVSAMVNECRCGVSIGVGIPDDDLRGHVGRVVTCGTCGMDGVCMSDEWVFHPYRFRPYVDPLEEQLSRIESEPVEEPELV